MVGEPEQDRAEWIARLRERARQDAEELVPRPAFAVFGLAAPRLLPVALTEAGQLNDVWESVYLAHGDWASPAGPYALVISAASADPTGAGATAELLHAIDTDRNRLAGQAGVDEAEPAEPPRYWGVSVAVGDDCVSGLAGQHGNVLAVKLRVGSVSVMVVSRGVELGAVRLAAVADLEPYLRGRDELLGQVAEQHRQRSAPVLAPAEGMAAYRALVDAELDSNNRFIAAMRAGRVPRHRADEGATIGALWQRAVSELADRASMGPRAADEVITSVVNQLTKLNEKAPWFTERARLRERAIDETLRHAVLGEVVPSIRAQRAWTGYWGYQTSVAIQAVSAPLESGARLGAEQLISRWLDEWADWTLRR